MNWKKLALIASMVGSLGLVGCGGDDGEGDGGGDPVVRTYVVSSLSLPASTRTQGAGFNLDGKVSDGSDLACDGVADVTSLTDASETGVDNALGGLVPTLEGFLDEPLDATLAQQIVEGKVLILMQVSDINSFNNDNSVQLQLFLGEVPGGGEPMLAGATLAPGQTFNGTPIGSAVAGTIQNGRLRGSAPSLNIAFEVSGTEVALNIRNAQIGATIRDAELSNGVIGGSIRVQDIVELAGSLGGIDPSTVESLIGTTADLEPNASGDTCSALSVGILFGGVGANLGS